MKSRSLLFAVALLAGASSAVSCRRLFHPQSSAKAKDVTAETSAIVDRINGKIAAGKASEEDFAPEIKAFDNLLAAHKGEKTDEVSEVLLTKASFYAMVFHNAEKALPLIRALKTDFPDTRLGQQADGMIAGLERQIQVEKIQRTLVVGAPFPDFAETDTAGQPLSVARFKGKIVLVDFWATWCSPCLASLPNVIKTYQQYHEQGFEIIGINLDQEGEGEQLAKFTQENDMPWPQFFDGQYWNNKLAVQYGVSSIPRSYLLDGAGKIIGVNLYGDELPAAVAKALGAKAP